MEHVFRSFYNNLDVPWSTEASLRLAMLVSKEFFEPARNILWRSIPSLSPVLRILCSHPDYSGPKSLESIKVPKNYLSTTIAYPSNNQPSARNQPCAREPTTTLLRRVQSYCRNVRHINLCQEDSENDLINAAGPQALHVMSLFRQVDKSFVLFPGLRRLDISLQNISDYDLPLIMLAISPKLSTVSLSNIGTKHQDWVTILEDMSNASLISAAVSSLTTVKDLSITFDSLNRKENMDRLRTTKSLSPGKIKFWEGLCSLTLKGSMVKLAALLSALNPLAGLSKLSLDVSISKWSDFDHGPPSEIHDKFFRSLERHSASVETFIVQITHGIPWALFVRTFQASWGSMKHLEIDLERVDIECDWSEGYRRDGIYGYDWLLKRSWPSLKTLKFLVGTWRSTHGFDKPDIHLTPLDLPRIARACPDLDALQLGISFPLKQCILSEMEAALNDIKNISEDVLTPGPTSLLIRVLPNYEGSWEPEPVLEFKQFQERHGAILMPYIRSMIPALHLTNLTFTKSLYQSHSPTSVCNWLEEVRVCAAKVQIPTDNCSGSARLGI